MPEPWMDWIKPALVEHFLEQDRNASNQEELKGLMERQQELTSQLRQQLSYDQFQLLLQWEENINSRCTAQKEWLYFAGLKEGFYIWKHLLNNLPVK
jgi:hypothetical protein